MIRTLEVVNLCLAGVIIYTYLGYPLILFILIQFKKRKKYDEWSSLPAITHVIAAYNEADCLKRKISNCFDLDYPSHLHEIIIVTDGSNDGSDHLVRAYDHITLLHQSSRAGKTAALNRGVKMASHPFIVFSDANTLLNTDCLQQLIRPFTRQDVGVAAGEKKIRSGAKDIAAGAGEGMYWQYESLLKRWDDRFYSAVGAAGELYAIRKAYFQPLDERILLDDFYISLSFAQRGHLTAYVPEAYAIEEPSTSIAEEYKRKTRIVAGGFQAMWLLIPLLNVFKYGRLSFQYISHRVLRWTLAPLGLPLVFVLSGILAFYGPEVYLWVFAGQLFFYLFALIGYFLQRRHLRMKIFFIPFYFTFMNYTVFPGFLRFLRGKQTVLWEKAKRM